MTNQRILLIGRGHLGSYLKARLGIPDELHYTGELERLGPAQLAGLHPEVVVNTAGKTDLRWCEDNALEAFRCNVSAPVAVWRAMRKAELNGSLFIHLSSGCVWDGPYDEQGAPFEPRSPAQPACFYSWTKAACDALLMDETSGRQLSILRPRQVYSPLPSPRNTLTKLRRYPRLIDTPNSMTSAETIARTIERVVVARDQFVNGRIMNVYDRGITSPYQVGVLMAGAGLREPPVAFTKQELDVELKPKRVDAVIHDAWFENLVDPPDVKLELTRVIAAYSEAQGS